MGLDMNLYLETKNAENDLEIGYWRKHPSLHEYLFSTFADPEQSDNVTRLDLDTDSIKKIIEDIKNDVYGSESPKGFFWGNSPLVGDEGHEEQKAKDLDIFENALSLLNDFKGNVYYQAWY